MKNKKKSKNTRDIDISSKQEFFQREKKHYWGFKKGFKRKYKKS